MTGPTVHITTVPERARYWPALRHHMPGCVLHGADERIPLPENTVAALKAGLAAPHDGWVWLAQDDIALADGLHAELPRIAATAPEDAGLISLYSWRERDPELLAERGPHWRRRARQEWVYMVLCAVRADLVVLLCDAITAEADEGCTSQDGPVMRWFNRQPKGPGRRRCYMALPNLTQHIGQQSTFGTGWRIFGRTRQSPTFIPEIDYDHLVVSLATTGQP